MDGFGNQPDPKQQSTYLYEICDGCEVTSANTRMVKIKIDGQLKEKYKDHDYWYLFYNSIAGKPIECCHKHINYIDKIVECINKVKRAKILKETRNDYIFETIEKFKGTVREINDFLNDTYCNINEHVVKNIDLNRLSKDKKDKINSICTSKKNENSKELEYASVLLGIKLPNNEFGGSNLFAQNNYMQQGSNINLDIEGDVLYKISFKCFSRSGGNLGYVLGYYSINSMFTYIKKENFENFVKQAVIKRYKLQNGFNEKEINDKELNDGGDAFGDHSITYKKIVDGIRYAISSYQKVDFKVLKNIEKKNLIGFMCDKTIYLLPSREAMYMNGIVRTVQELIYYIKDDSYEDIKSQFKSAFFEKFENYPNNKSVLDVFCNSEMVGDEVDILRPDTSGLDSQTVKGIFHFKENIEKYYGFRK